MRRLAMILAAGCCLAAAGFSTGRAMVMRQRARGIDIWTAQALLNGLEVRARQSQLPEGRGTEGPRSSSCVEFRGSALPASSTMLRGLASANLEIRRVESDRYARTGVIEATGSATGVRDWLRSLDAATEEGCTVVDRLDLAPVDSRVSVGAWLSFPLERAVRLSLPSPETIAATAAQFRAALETRLDSAGARTPADDLVAYAVGVTNALGVTHAVSATRAVTAAQPPGITILGTVVSAPPDAAPRNRYVIRVERGPLLVLGPGEAEFGWRLLSASDGQIRLDHKGVIHEIDRR